MNTAPKLQHIEVLRELRVGVSMDAAYDPAGQAKLFALDAAIAALAPPSGDGVDSKCPHCGAPTRKEILMRGGDNGWGDDASRTVYRYATPQSAPVDGDLEALIKAEYGNAMRQLNAEGKRATQTSIRELAEILALRPTTPPPASQERGGVALIAAERERQLSVEGWTPEHDDEHADGSLAVAAACYAAPVGAINPRENLLGYWPWDWSWWKPSPDNRVRELVKAGALIAAEIDRLQRASPPSSAALLSLRRPQSP